MVKKFRVMVWKDYKVSESYYKTVEAETEEEAMELAEEAIREENYDCLLGDQEIYDVKIQSNENSIEVINEKK